MPELSFLLPDALAHEFEENAGDPSTDDFELRGNGKAFFPGLSGAREHRDKFARPRGNKERSSPEGTSCRSVREAARGFVIIDGAPVAPPLDVPGRESKTEREVFHKALLVECVAGSHLAFTKLYDCLEQTLFSLVLQIIRDRKDAEDVLQDAFVHMWKKAAQYDPNRGTVFTWAAMIARSKAIDRIRARQRRQKVTEAAAAEGQETSFSPADYFAAQREETQRVLVALAEMPEAQREVFYLAFFGGLTHLEISEKLKSPLGTVKARIRRGLHVLRRRWTTA